MTRPSKVKVQTTMDNFGLASAKLQLGKDIITPMQLKNPEKMTPTVVNCSLASGTQIAPYVAKTDQYSHNLTLTSEEPFSVTKMLISSGDYKGRHILMLETVPAHRFAFMELPLEVRIMIYRWYLCVDGPIEIERQLRPRASRNSARIKKEAYWNTTPDPFTGYCPTNLLRVSRQVHEEAAEILYGHNRFRFEGPNMVSTFVLETGSCAKYLRDVEMEFYWKPTARKAFNSMVAASNLQRLRLHFFNRRDDSAFEITPVTAKRLSKDLKTLLLALQARRNDREAVFAMLSCREEGACTSCQKPAAPVPGNGLHAPFPLCYCTQANANYTLYMRDLKDACFGYLLDWPKRGGG